MIYVAEIKINGKERYGRLKHSNSTHISKHTYLQINNHGDLEPVIKFSVYGNKIWFTSTTVLLLPLMYSVRKCHSTYVREQRCKVDSPPTTFP